MAETTEKKETVETKKKMVPNKIKQLPPTENASKNSFLILGLALVIAILAVSIALFSIYHNSQYQKKLLNEHILSIKELNKLKTIQANEQLQIKANNKSIAEIQDNLEKKLDHLHKQLQIAMDQRLYQNQDWLLLKARYYLELAQLNAHWSTDFNAALSLMQQADKLLAQLHSIKIINIRQALAKEMAQVKAIAPLDVAGLLSKIDAAQQSVASLTLQIATPNDDTELDLKKTQTSSWDTHFQSSMDLLNKLIVIRRDDEKIPPLISPIYESMLKESIRFNLQEAQWAVLNNNPIIYLQALKQAQVNLKKAFNNTTPQTTALMDQLNELQQIKIAQEKPVIELSLALLNQIIDNKELLTAPASNNRKEENKQ